MNEMKVTLTLAQLLDICPPVNSEMSKLTRRIAIPKEKVKKPAKRARVAVARAVVSWRVACVESIAGARRMNLSFYIPLFSAMPGTSHCVEDGHHRSVCTRVCTLALVQLDKVTRCYSVLSFFTLYDWIS